MGEYTQPSRDATQRFVNVLSGTEIGVWEWNMETDEVIWSESLQRLLGIEPGTFDGTFEAHAEYVHPDDMPRIERAIAEALDGDGSFGAEFRMHREDGELIWVRGQGELVTDGEDRRMIGITTNITERKERERSFQPRTERSSHSDTLRECPACGRLYNWTISEDCPACSVRGPPD